MKEYNNEIIANLADMGFHAAVGYIMSLLADEDPKFSVLYSDCGNRFNACMIQQKHPEKCYEVGIAEQNQLGMAAAMCLEGYNVFALAYAPFITARVLDQIRINMGYMQAPVKLIGLGAGLSISDLGATHMAVEDIANLRGIPNMVVMSPADCLELAKMLEAVAKLKAPVYIRIATCKVGQTVYTDDYEFHIGRAVTLKQGCDVLMIAAGTLVYEALKASQALEAQGISCTVLNMHTVKPLDVESINQNLHHRLIVTIEEHSIIGGLGGAVAEYLSQMPTHPPLCRIGLPDSYYYADTPDKLRKEAGLAYREIAARIFSLLK